MSQEIYPSLQFSGSVSIELVLFLKILVKFSSTALWDFSFLWGKILKQIQFLKQILGYLGYLFFFLCLFHLNCQTYWHKVYNISFVLLIYIESSDMTSLSPNFGHLCLLSLFPLLSVQKFVKFIGHLKAAFGFISILFQFF